MKFIRMIIMVLILTNTSIANWLPIYNYINYYYYDLDVGTLQLIKTRELYRYLNNNHDMVPISFAIAYLCFRENILLDRIRPYHPFSIIDDTNIDNKRIDITNINNKKFYIDISTIYDIYCVLPKIINYNTTSMLGTNVILGDYIELLINYMYARKGYAFKERKWMTIFTNTGWYSPVNSFNDKLFTKNETYNIKYLYRFKELLISNNCFSNSLPFNENYHDSGDIVNLITNCDSYLINVLIENLNKEFNINR